MALAVNIVCLDVPYPANYGGAINMFHKIRWLHKQGVQIYLHCFTYGDRQPTDELQKYCKKVYYYERKTNVLSFLSLLPYNVKSRISQELKSNLLRTDSPIIFEALHSCYLLKDKSFENRKKIFRESNIEHEYFFHLAKNEKQFFKRIYLFTEAFKLRYFERVVAKADLMLVVSTEDQKYFETVYPTSQIKYLPSFHQNDNFIVKAGVSDYILYHGNLSVSENYMAADWLIDHVFSKQNHKVVVAGLNPPKFLKEKIAAHSHITLKENCTREEMDDLIENAQIHCLYTPQATGLKLKLLNVLFKGRFVVANRFMIHGTSLQDSCNIVDTPEEFINAIEQCLGKEFTNDLVDKRKEDLKIFDNESNVNYLIDYIRR